MRNVCRGSVGAAAVIIAEQKTWKCGPYTVRQAVRLDNPAFPRYVVLRRQKIVGCSFSVPDRSQCEFIERFHKQGEVYVTASPIKKYHYRLPKQLRAGQRKATRAKYVRDILAAKPG